MSPALELILLVASIAYFLGACWLAFRCGTALATTRPFPVGGPEKANRDFLSRYWIPVTLTAALSLSIVQFQVPWLWLRIITLATMVLCLAWTLFKLAKERENSELVTTAVMIGYLYVALLPVLISFVQPRGTLLLPGLPGFAGGIGICLIAWKSTDLQRSRQMAGRRLPMTLLLIGLTGSYFLSAVLLDRGDVEEELSEFESTSILALESWELPARWALEANPDLDLSRPRRVLDEIMERGGDKADDVLGIATRTGLVDMEALAEHFTVNGLRDTVRQDLARTGHFGSDGHLRALWMLGQLSSSESDELRERLRGLLRDELAVTSYLPEVTRYAELLLFLGELREGFLTDTVHEFLRRHWIGTPQFAGHTGFAPYHNPKRPLGSDTLEATLSGLRLLRRFGIPEGIDTIALRASLRGRAAGWWSHGTPDHRLLAYAGLLALDTTPGAARPGLLDYLVHDHLLIALIILIALCLHATTQAPPAVLVETPPSRRKGEPEAELQPGVG